MGSVFAIWFVLGIVGMFIGSAKGKAGAGFLLGFLLGPIGWIIAALMTPAPQVQAQQNAAVERAQQALTGSTADYGELERLYRLHQSGALSADEYEAEKRRLLAPTSPLTTRSRTAPTNHS